MKVTPKYTRSIDDYVKVTGEDDVNELKALGESFRGKSILHINSTPYGGGVAEILHSMVPLMKSLDIDARWEVIEAEDDFFNITKKIHNGLQGNLDISLTEEEWEVYLKWNRYNAEILDLDADFIIVHDPQPMALPSFAKKGKQHWIWRCHIDLTHPNPLFWRRLGPLVNQYDAVIVHSEEYIRDEFKDKAFVSPPSIDPLSDKNRELTGEEVVKVSERFNVDPEKPSITKVARFDPWKDIPAAIDVYKILKKKRDLQLLIISMMARDDPEGLVFYEKVKEHVGQDEDIHILTDEMGVRDLEVNAFQRGSRVGIHTAIREGFGLVVSEMLWKRVPVVARPVGGVKIQVIHGVTGYTASTVQDLAQHVESLLENAGLRKSMGEAGREHVRRNFVITRHVYRYLSLLAKFL
ncbi:glycosyl transferase family 1 [Infirmifilum uzonense]|uniref:Glycosyl transferase family 1 n=1 Tax=Infirmifilum uzonense TaxID=1550241 RepID=A0A0F7CLF0_9CREN|nr:glycosyltransferase [Infirmifilum uzonense]AKG39296.1 glycosyl transferase family 1 [Infirmifilum uzonense]